MRIAIVSHSSNLEGAERSLLEVIDSLVNCGHSLMVVVRESGDFTSVLRERGVEYHLLNYGWWATENKAFSNSWLKKADIIATQITKVIDAFGAQLVYTNTSVIPFGALAAVKAGVPHVWHIRELATGKIFDRFRDVLPQIGSIISLTSNRVIFNSEATRESWKNFVKDFSKSEVVYNPITNNESVHQNEGGAFRVAVIGSILPIKNQMEALQAFKSERIKNSALELDIIGPDRNKEYYQSLQQFVDENNLAEKVNFKGYMEHPFSEKPNLCLVCGNSEGFGRVSAEAIMCGIPVLASRGGATNELIKEGETGFLYESGNIAELVEKLLSLSQANLADHVKKASDLIGEKFSRDNTVVKLLQILERVSKEEHPLVVLRQFLDPFGDHKNHLEYVGSVDLLKEVFRRKLGLASDRTGTKS